MTDHPIESPEVLTGLLLHFGWCRTAGSDGLYEVWSPDSASDDEVLVPLDTSRGDYYFLLHQAIRAIVARYDQRGQQIFDLLSTRHRADLSPVCWRKDTSEVSGIIPWVQGASLFESARTQLIAAAKSAINPLAYHGNSNSYFAQAFLDSTFMGQTDFGSFVITAYAPRNKALFETKADEVRAEKEPPGLFPQGVVSSSVVVKTFDRALRSLKAGLDEYRSTPRVELFGETVSDGVSYELVKAIAEVTSTGSLEIGIGRTYSELREKDQNSVITFEPTEAPVLERVQHALAQTAESRQVTIAGFVTLLSKQDEPGVRLIRIQVQSGAGPGKVKVRLNEEQHETALRAYHDGALFSVKGRLEREGNRFWLYDAQDARILDVSDSDAESSPTLYLPREQNAPMLFGADVESEGQ